MGAAAAGISAGASILNGVIGGKAAKKSAKIQAQAAQQALGQQQAQFEQTRSDNMPFLQAGQSAIGDPNGLLALLGLSGDPAQAGAISGLRESPLFQAQYDTGADTILQNASATGGLRGGNTNNSLAQFGSQLFGSVYDNQLSRLMQLAGIGSNAGQALGNFGQQNATATSGLLTQQGKAQAGGVLGQAAAATTTINDLGKLLGNVTGGKTGGSGGYAGAPYAGGWS